MSAIGTYQSEKYGLCDIGYVCTGGSSGYWIAKTLEGEFITTADSSDELKRELDGREG